jgi:hypothetical protein
MDKLRQLSQYICTKKNIRVQFPGVAEYLFWPRRAGSLWGHHNLLSNLLVWATLSSDRRAVSTYFLRICAVSAEEQQPEWNRTLLHLFWKSNILRKLNASSWNNFTTLGCLTTKSCENESWAPCILNLGTNRSEWSASRPGRFTWGRKKTWKSEPVWTWFGREQHI